MVFHQRFERHPKSGKARETRHFVGRTVRLLGMAPTQRRRLFAIQAFLLQVLLHQRLRIKPAHSKFLPNLMPAFGNGFSLGLIPLMF
jgi:hypothetical protein